MDKFVILTDFACDLSQEIRDQFQMADYMKGHVTISDGRDIEATMDWSHISREEFYGALSNHKLQVSSSPASPEQYYEAFKKYVEEGYKVLTICLSSKISSTYNVACGAADRVRGEYPDCTIYCLDSYRMSSAFGLLVVYAYEMKNNGKDFDEIIQWLEENKYRVHQMGPIDDLIFIARRGRISMGKAVMGSFAGVKPMGDCSSDGYVSVLTKVKGINKALDLTVKYTEKMAQDVQNQYVIVAHSNREAYAQKLKAMLEETLNPKQVLITDVFCGCGTNIGPGMVGVYFLGNAVTEDLAVEKDTINSLL